MMYARVVFPMPGNSVFTYEIPENLRQMVQPGSRVTVPLGRRNSSRKGFVIEVTKHLEFDRNITVKSIINCLDDEPIFSPTTFEISKWMSDYYLSSIGTALSAAAPIPPKTKPRKVHEPPVDYSAKTAHKLNKHQMQAVDSIRAAIISGRSEVFLLHGVTGSGKTEVYMQTAETALNAGCSANSRGVIILVPEISLTPQTVSRLVGRFGSKVAVLHSRLSNGERYHQWQRIKSGSAPIVVGARSAIFAPLPKVGLIVVDEEHETSYKQNSSPRYNTCAVALKRSQLEECPLVLSTATPSLESFYCAETEKYHLLTLPHRATGAKMPSVEVVDMRKELKRGNRTIFSRVLQNCVRDRLSKGQQIILFLNRRGHSSYVFCRECGHSECCENCSVSLTFHFGKKLLTCHHCGNERQSPRICPACNGEQIRYLGLGTEKVEQEILRMFPRARVCRMDRDATTRKGSHEEILDRFKRHEFDILIGTQMIAKGLDFPNVTLVGVVMADTTLNLPDFRAGERTFNLLAQVSGRSGRGELSGGVIIQTYMPEHYSIKAAKHQSYLQFYQKELEYRKALFYPPYSHVARILLSGSHEETLIRSANNLLGILETAQSAFPEVKLRGPVPAPIGKIRGKFRWHFILRAKSPEEVRGLIRSALAKSKSIGKSGVKIIVDIDPTTIL